ncbi:MAG: MFS transporter, partial [Bacteroidota bacterium]
RIFQWMVALDGALLLFVSYMVTDYEIIPVYWLAAVYGLTLFTYNLHYPNLYAFVQELFEPRYYSMVNSAIEIQGQVTNALGMLTAGVLLVGSADGMPGWWPTAWQFEAWSMAEIFRLDGSTYLMSFVLISLIRYIPDPGKRIDKGAVLARIQQGFQYLWSRKPLLVFGVSSHMIFFSLLVLMHFLLAVYVKDYLQANADTMAHFKGMYAVGAVLSGLIMLRLAVVERHVIKVIVSLLLMTASMYVICIFLPWVWGLLAVAVILGLCNAGARILRITYIIRVVPTRVVGRVNAFFSVVNVAFRSAFLSLMTIPFFSGPDSGHHVLYAFGILAVLLYGSAGLLYHWRGAIEKS